MILLDQFFIVGPIKLSLSVKIIGFVLRKNEAQFNLWIFLMIDKLIKFIKNDQVNTKKHFKKDFPSTNT